MNFYILYFNCLDNLVSTIENKFITSNVYILSLHLNVLRKKLKFQLLKFSSFIHFT